MHEYMIDVGCYLLFVLLKTINVIHLVSFTIPYIDLILINIALM